MSSFQKKVTFVIKLLIRQPYGCHLPSQGKAYIVQPRRLYNQTNTVNQTGKHSSPLQKINKGEYKMKLTDLSIIFVIILLPFIILQDSTFVNGRAGNKTKKRNSAVRRADKSEFEGLSRAPF